LAGDPTADLDSPQDAETLQLLLLVGLSDAIASAYRQVSGDYRGVDYCEKCAEWQDSFAKIASFR
jgi:hypothetical protein